MDFQSTRGDASRSDAWAAIARGIAPDGGLFVPSHWPRLTPEALEALVPLDYRRRALAVLAPWLGDEDTAQLAQDIDKAYCRFDAPDVTPLAPLGDNTWVLELWHGPTAAFKDVALQLLPRLMTRARQQTGAREQTLILTATSGDTGKAALEGFQDVPGTRIVVFYPKEGVSAMQRRQMQTQAGENVCVVAVEGNFDDAQSGVKAIFSDPQMRERAAQQGYAFSSANSINFGRLAPQIVYYVSAWCDLRAKGAIAPGQAVDFVVPTGNFGDILAGWYAKAMGLPVGRLVCASNSNHILSDFFATGVYDTRRSFLLTQSPSMDILISSNLERLLYEAADRDGAQVRAWMDGLRHEGHYTVPEPVRRRLAQDFAWGWADEDETRAAIGRVWREHRYLLIPIPP
jgi:threonine synthase